MIGRGHKPQIIMLLSVDFAGKTYRFASEKISFQNAYGKEFQHESGFDEEFSESFDFLGEVSSFNSVQASVVFPVSVSALVSEGARLSGAAAEVAMIDRSDSWEGRIVLLEGVVSAPTYGRQTDPVKFSVRGLDLADAGTIYSSAIKDGRNKHFSIVFEEDAKDDSLPPPFVFGSPGATAKAATYASYLEATSDEAISAIYEAGIGASSDSGTASRIIWLRPRVYVASVNYCDATTATLLNSYGESTVNLKNVVLPGLGNVCVLDVPLYETVAGKLIWSDVSWSQPKNPNGAGSVALAMLLRSSSLSVDVQAWETALPYLDQYLVAGMFNEEAAPLDFVQQSLLVGIPVAVVNGPRGLRPVVWDQEYYGKTPVETLSDRPGCSWSGRFEEPSARATGRRARVSYALGVDGDYLDVAIVGGSEIPVPGAENTDDETVKEIRIELPCVWDRGTAIRIGQKAIQAKVRSPRYTTFEADSGFLWIKLGDPVTLSIPEAGVDTVGTVIGRTIDAGGVSLTVVLT